MLKISIFFGLVTVITSSPVPNGNTEVSGSATVGLPPFLTFKDGRVGVNFFGFKASAGLGGLLTGDASHGGLHAEAETPFGQKAAAGLGGRVNGQGRSVGGLYAGATAGGGVGAAAGLDGVADGEGSSVGRSYAGASAGGVSKTVIKERFNSPPGGGEAKLSGSINIQKIPTLISKPPSEVVVDAPIAPKVNSNVEIEVVKEAVPIPKKTYIERTVIPNYVEKTIQVPSYVEKTVRVPTVVEKVVKVPAPPTIIEKEVPVPEIRKEVAIEENVPSTTIIRTKTKLRRRPWLHIRKRVNINSNEIPKYGGVVVAEPVSSISSEGGSNFGYAPKYYAGTTTIRKEYNGNLFRDIFNIPIATLGAVSNLVGNIADGTSGAFAVSKSYKAY
ncbi:hypothetical protein ABEB36_013700 [Hypothenemus hampei]|uniref:Uncharacterized protein n=1 Tax=Hypothenemus hampei TaxID=57062 RepID=A0ABD1E5Z5_HYPHA